MSEAAPATKQEDANSMVHISRHPVLSHKITILRSSATAPGTFRAVLKEITYHLGYEATLHDLSTVPVDISVPGCAVEAHPDWQGHKLHETVALIPILRSGLCMVDSMLDLVPTAAVHHIGMYKAQHDLMPVEYYSRLPRQCTADVAYVLDTVIATSTTVASVLTKLKKWGVKRIHVICVLCSQQGLDALQQRHPDVGITVGCIDEMKEDGRLWPGLGDSGDRLFGTVQVHDETALVHPSVRGRKRTMSQG